MGLCLKLCLSVPLNNSPLHSGIPHLLQGRSLAVAAAKVFDGVSSLPQLMSAVDEDDAMEGHFTVVFGAVCGALSLHLHPTVLMFLFGSLQTVIASAVRLGHVGPMEVSRVGCWEQRNGKVTVYLFVLFKGMLLNTLFMAHRMVSCR